MIPALACAGHAVLDAWLGWVLLGQRRGGAASAGHLPAALLLGMYADTLFVGALLFLGLPLLLAAIFLAGATVTLTALAWQRGTLRRPSVRIERPRWFEGLVFLSVAEKAGFALWQLLRTPVYFDDALTHWAGRARALYGGVNWSLDPHSPVWLGYDAAARHYPLLTVVWRAETALLAGGWDDLVARADGVLFFGAAVATVWLAVLHFARARWFAAVAAFLVAAVPLQAWHAAAGYSDLGVEAFGAAALAALLRREWFLAGALAAGTAWTKNDGLVLFLPPLFLGALLLDARKGLWFLAGCATLAPWLLVKIWLALGIAPNQDRFQWHPEAPGEFFTKVLAGPTGSILWLGILATLLVSARTMLREPTGRALLGIASASLAAAFVVYGGTEAHVWLTNDGTIHRTMLQLSASAVIIACYGLWQQVRTAPLVNEPKA